MKYLVSLIIFLFSGGCFSVEVTATGTGNNFINALDNAKIAAIEAATSTWISSKHEYSSNSGYKEDIRQYNGGVITKYRIIDQTQNSTTITADVVQNKGTAVKINNTTIIDENVKSNIRIINSDNEKIKNAVDYLRQQSYIFNVDFKSVTIMPVRQNNEVTIEYDISFNPKWLSDIKTLAKTYNKAQKPENTGEVCFSSTKNTSTFWWKPECYGGNNLFEPIVGTNDMICVNIVSDKRILRRLNLNNTMFMLEDITNNHPVSYKNKSSTLMIYEKESIRNMKTTFFVKDIYNIDEISFNFIDCRVKSNVVL